ncbi:VRR-NUC domain-containing protein [Marinobacter sp. CHS3-4]|uniref:VRR-NUC domain-containing protein n=1 Tax=Marinobacter sp. CHS3-4 TaxID=3045174 RepID=UPI0024B4F71F|nr:VRR-NUC domain-containing protein [Marinobacter sp. CHS3-4]MDI9246346.1 VRR-NUC domain-containing protein [Marinobacter sp. CHS3-4]
MPDLHTEQTTQVPQTADLNDPLYYLANFETVIRWVRDHHSDLLLTEESRLVDNLMDLPADARALVARMVMRTGDGFRVEKLHYPELVHPISQLMDVLEEAEWIDASPSISVAELFRLYTLPELKPELAQYAAETGLSASASKAQLKQAMGEAFPEAAPVSAWLPNTKTRLIRLQHMALFDRLRLMFFGNLRQTWSDFVLVELGHHQYEKVPFTPDARAFDKREDVDRYLLLHHCRERLDEGETPEAIWQAIPEASDNAWLESRRGRLLFELARQAEREKNIPLALETYSESQHREARLRYLRLLERQKRFREAWDLASRAAGSPRNDAEVQGLKRLMSRLAKKLDQTLERATPKPQIPTTHLTLDNPSGHSVEWRVMEHLHTDDEPVAYVENTLITGLFGLLCWPAIFAPVPGAFFHPFHIGPVDLYREDFLSRRKALFDRCLEQLQDGTWKQAIRHTWQEKYGIASPFVVWPVFSETLLELALHCLPAQHLERLFHRMLADLRQHRSGFPDLIRFKPDHPDPQQRYEMIEVKGPGDRLQDHQVRWLEYCLENNLPVSVCYVRWSEVLS